MSGGAHSGGVDRELLYVADPMCSWCYAFAPVLKSVRTDLRGDVGTRLVLGGLARDDDQPMSQETREYIQGAWRSIEQRTPARFNWEYWDHCQPRRSTWPACRAVLAAGDRGEEMFEAIQRAYYQEARDPSDLGVLAAIAGELGFDGDGFARSMQSAEMRNGLKREFQLRDRLYARSFPSVGVRTGEEYRLLASGWVEEPELRAILDREQLLRG